MPSHLARQCDDGAALLHRAFTKAQFLLNRPGTLELLPPPQLRPIPQAQSALIRLPAELRTKIFEQAVRYDDEIGVPVLRNNGYHSVDEKEHYRATALLQVCRQTHQETLQPFFALDTFVFDVSYCTSQNPAAGKWLNTMSSSLRSLHHFVFIAPYFNENSISPDEWISVSIDWILHGKQWSVASTADHSTIEWPSERGLHIHSSKLLCRILRTMLDQRTPAYFTSSYLFWLIYDLKRFYYGCRLLECARRYTKECRRLDLRRLSGLPPAVTRPQNMYTSDLEMQYSGEKQEAPSLRPSLEMSKQYGLTIEGIRNRLVMQGRSVDGVVDYDD